MRSMSIRSSDMGSELSRKNQKSGEKFTLIAPTIELAPKNPRILGNSTGWSFSMPVPSRLPFPYRPEAEIVASQLQRLAGALDWAAAAHSAQPWVQAVRHN